MTKLKLKVISLLTAGIVLLLVFFSDLYGQSAADACGKQPAVPSEQCLHALGVQDQPGQNQGSSHASQALSFAKQVDIQRLMDDVIWLADDARQGRHTGYPGEDAAAKWMMQRYQQLGLQPFKQAGLSDYLQEFTFPFHDEYLQGKNVIGILPGTTHANEFVVISAHYDHLGIEDGEIYNGADDDASGVATVLEMARVFTAAEVRPQKSILFVAFSGEELGHIGSGHFCYQMFMQRAVDKITVLNLEMLGAVRDTYTNIWEQDTALAQPIVAAVVAASKQLNLPLLVSAGRDPGSDAVELLDCKIAATTIDAGGGDDFYDNHPHYHEPTDDPEHIDRNGFLKSAQVATIAIWRLANNEFK